MRNFMTIPYPVHANRFSASYSCGTVKYDFLSVQTVSANYDLALNKLICTIELDVEGKVEYLLSKMCGRGNRPTISVNRLDGTGEVLYSTMCEIDEVESCAVEADYTGSSRTAKAILKCAVRDFDVVIPEVE